MLRKAIAGTGTLIALYLVLENWVGFSNDAKAGASGVQTTIKTLQGR